MSKGSFELSQPPVGAVIGYLIGDEGILFSHATGCLYRLNTTAAFMWCCREESLSLLKTAGMVAEKFNITRKQARQDVVRIFSEWQSLDLLATTALEAAECQHSSLSTQHTEVKTLSFPYPSPAQCERHYRLLDADLQVQYPCRDIEKLVHPIVAHLEVCPDDGKKACNATFAIAEKDGGYILLRDRVPVSDRVHALELGPAIQRQALVKAYQSTDCLAAIHAAAVCNGNRTVLLPGTSGSGKSTLTAMLMALGLTYLTDELTLLMPNTHHIRPAPVSLCLKRGSWAILASRYNFPWINPIYLQEGKEIRYLPVPEGRLHSQEAYSVECIVFPKYRAGVLTSLKKLGAAEALYRVAEAGYAIPGRLNKNNLEELISWIEQLDCYELQMGDLGKAAYKIKELLA